MASAPSRAAAARAQADLVERLLLHESSDAGLAALSAALLAVPDYDPSLVIAVAKLAGAVARAPR